MADTERYKLNDRAAQVYEEGPVPLMFRPLAELTFRHVTLQTNDRVMDAACGTGIVTRVAIERFKSLGKVVGVDLTAEMLDVARQSMPKSNVRVEWQHADLCALPFPDGGFDVVLCQQGLQFIPDKAGAVREMKRMLVFGGRFIFTAWIESPYHTALADALTRHVNAQAARSCLAPYNLHDREVVRKLVSDAGFSDIDMKTLSMTIRVSPSSAASLFEIVAARSSFAREIAGVSKVLKQEVDAALQKYRDGGDFMVPWKTHLVQARAE